MIDSEWVLKWVPTCEWGPQLVSTGFDSSLKSFSKAVPKIFSGHWLSLWHSNDTILGPSQLSSPDQQVLLRILIPVSHVWLQMDHWDHPLHRPTIILVKDLKIKLSGREVPLEHMTHTSFQVYMLVVDVYCLPSNRFEGFDKSNTYLVSRFAFSAAVCF